MNNSPKKPNYEDFKHRENLEAWERERDEEAPKEVEDVDAEGHTVYVDSLEKVKGCDSDEVFVLGGAKKIGEMAKWTNWAQCREGRWSRDWIGGGTTSMGYGCGKLCRLSIRKKLLGGGEERRTIIV